MPIRKTKIDTGEVQCTFGYDPRVSDFLGVPYAAPPVGDLRWKGPQPVKPWDGVLMCDKYKPIAWQPVPGGDPNEFYAKEIHPTGPEFPMNEDCLYLNIYTCAESTEDKLPVLYYIHGGGYRGGYPYEIEFDWEHMAKKGIVVVTVCYRLGVFGYLAHPLLHDEAPNEPEGNYGMLDQMAGLQWVKRNIAAFGGDPDRVTIAGQSAGAGGVQYQYTSPMTEGLINGAIIQSAVGADFQDIPVGRQLLSDALEKGKKFFDYAGFKSLEEARACPAEQVFKMADEAFGPRGASFQPIIDGKFIIENQYDAYVKGHHRNIPTIAGYNAGEARGMFQRFTKLPKTLEEFNAFADQYGDKAEVFKSKVKTDEDVQKLMNEDAFIGCIAGERMYGYIQSGHGRNAYLYEFDVDIPGEDNAGSYHGAELWFAYDALGRCWRPFTGKHYDLARQISSYWVNFVKTGDPNGKDTFGYDLPRWEAFNPENQFVMGFTDVCAKKDWETDELMKLRIDYSINKVKEGK